MRETLFTIGHANHSLAHLALLLRQHGVTAVADVRSHPSESTARHFHPAALAEALHASSGIAYVYLGRQLGEWTDDPECLCDTGHVDWERLARSLSFRNGVARLRKGLERFRIALLGTEADPLECHRGILIAPRVRSLAGDAQHIRPDGSLESFAEAEQRLLRDHDGPQLALFEDEGEKLRAAYARQAARLSLRSPAIRANHSA
jgi:hypothetical protein